MSEITEILRVAAGAAAPIAAPALANNASGYLGATGNVILAVSAGALAAFAFVKGKEPRLELFKVAAGSVVIGSAATTLLTEFIKWKYHVSFEPVVVSAFGVIVGAMLRFVLPPFIERIPGWLDSIQWPFFRKPTK